MNTIPTASALHRGLLRESSQFGSSAFTVMPTPGQFGELCLPVVGPNGVSEAQHLSLKAHEFAHLSLDDSGLLPAITAHAALTAAGVPNPFIQAALDLTANAVAGAHARDLPMFHGLSPQRVNEVIDQADACQLVAGGLQLASIVHQTGNNRRRIVDAHERTWARMGALHNGDHILHGIGALLYACEPLAHPRPDVAFSLSYFLDLVTQLWEYARAARDFEQRITHESPLSLDDMSDDERRDQRLRWSDMRIVRGSLTEDMRRLWKQRHQPRYQGALRYMHRTLTDMKVWSLRDRSVPPRTVLVDCSGSMNLSADDLLRMLQQQPASLIAGYGNRGATGMLFIVGENGLFADQEHLYELMDFAGGGNGIDGPALRWLASHRGRKVWVSDNAVTGRHDVFHTGNDRECALLVRRSGIELYRSVDAYLEGQSHEWTP